VLNDADADAGWHESETTAEPPAEA
jgi:hypothetical protein